MEILLNTIALEPNRWTEKKIPHFRLADLIGPIAAAGFRALEVWQNHVALLSRAELQALRRRAQEAGIGVAVVGMYPVFHLEGGERQEELARWERMFGIADTFGAGALKVMPGRVPSAQMTGKIWDRSVEFVREVCRLAERRALIIPLETHAGTLADDPEALLRFMEAVGSGALKVCWQPFDFSSSLKAIELYDRLAPHVVHLHLQGRRGNEMALLEESDIDYRRVLPHIFASGFDGYLSIEFVRDCVVDFPERFDLDTVLANAHRDMRFLEAISGFRA